MKKFLFFTHSINSGLINHKPDLGPIAIKTLIQILIRLNSDIACSFTSRFLAVLETVKKSLDTSHSSE